MFWNGEMKTMENAYKQDQIMRKTEKVIFY